MSDPPAFSWLRVTAVVLVVACAFSIAWTYGGLSTWAVERSRAALGLTAPPASGAPVEFDPALWERALRYWEPFTFDVREAARVTELGIRSYVPLDNLARIEDRVTGRRPNRTEVLDGLRQVDSILLRYPQRFLKAAAVERLVWLCEIVKDGSRAHGFAMPPANALVLDPTAIDPDVFHHEIFHMVDYRLHGHPGEQPAWNALNPAGVEYIGLAAYADELRRGKGLGHSNPYFITDYARATANEDRAETFRLLMQHPELARSRRAESAVIDAKARYVLGALDALASGSTVALGLR